MAGRYGPRYLAGIRGTGVSQMDLVVLVADKDMEQAMRGLLQRRQSLAIRTLTFNIFSHPEHDPACARHGVEFLSNLSKQYDHGLLLFDHQGCGREGDAPETLQQSLNDEFMRTEWADRAKAIVIAPELEAWIWSESPNVDVVAGWHGRSPRLREWLVAQGLLLEGESKPHDPKQAFHAALREVGMARSASLYRQLAEKVSLQACEDRSFQELKSTLQAWFPRAGAPHNLEGQ